MATTDVRTDAAPVQKFTFTTMTAMVVGSMVGAGVFSPVELVILTISVAGAIGGVVALATGWISI
jgi:arginine:ornithine antiporter / lysine permease